MKTKIYFWLCATLCVLSLTMSGCKEDKPTDGRHPAPPYISVTGIITGEDGSPIESIRIVADSSALNSDNWWQTDQEEYSANDGSYALLYMSSVDYRLIKWPTELTLIAQDTSGMYETQSQTFPIEMRQRYPNIKDLNYVYDGWVTANFVLKKK